MNGNDGVNIADVRTIVRECAASFLTYVSAEELAELVAEQVETMDCLELVDDDVTWERVVELTPIAA